MFTKLVLLLCVPAILLMGEEGAQYSIGEIPEWVKPYECPVYEIPVKPSQTNVQCILSDYQENRNAKTSYCHRAVKALSPSGVDDISQLQIHFNPAYYQVVVHAIRVLREGLWSDRLADAKQSILQRETGLDQNLYHGNLTLVYFLNDIREGDVLEYAYSIVGENPLYASHYTDIFSFQQDESIEKIVYRFLAPPSFSFRTKAINTDIQPQVTDLSSSVREWVWESAETPPYLYEPGQPIWHNPVAHVQISQFANWGEVAQKESLLYNLPLDFFESITPDMQALVEGWLEAAPDDETRALLALRFVQDKIRYLGIEEGIGAVEPRPPSLTFQRRFGDCKDKTILLHAFLTLMDIDSTPLLVHSTMGNRLPDALPMPCLFDHVVLQLQINEKVYFVDPTIQLQGGSLESNYFPNYGWGLLMDPRTDALTPLPKPSMNGPVTIETSIILESQDMARLKIESVLYDAEADMTRNWFERQGIKKISEDCLAEVQKIYGAVSADLPMEVFDDRENNIFRCTESYHLPMQKLGDKRVLEVFSYVLNNHLYDKVSPLRNSPYKIKYPHWIKEHIHIENPFIRWELFEDTYEQNHESLAYKLVTYVNEHHADFDIELKHLQDHIPQASLQDYWNIVKDINWKALPRLTIAGPKETVAHDDN